MLLYWIWFAELKKLPLHQKQRLLEHFHDPEDIYHADAETFAHIEGLENPDALEDKDLSGAERILKECGAKGIGILTFGDDAYPTRLRNTFDAPVVLYYKGILPDWETVPVIGIVGTRKATPYGVNTAARFGMQIAACGALVVSGGASGIDTAALEGAMQTAMPVAAVLGCGVDVVYPRSNAGLFDRIAEKGCLLSEFPPGAQALAWHFPQRNRIITGLSNGLLVVEAPEKSGALNSARHAMEQGRDVYVVPGNVDSPSCTGSNALLQERASAALSGWDVVKEYEALFPGKLHRYSGSSAVLKVAQEPVIPVNSGNLKTKSNKKPIDKEEKSTYSVLNNASPALDASEQAVLALITREGSLTDEIIARAGMPAGTVKSILTKLALKRLVTNHPGGRVSLK